MNVYTMVFLIVAIVMVTQMVKAIVLGNKSSKNDGRLARDIADLKQQLTAMDTRIKNVETIVTSKDFQLEQEFESLKQ